MQKEIKEMLRFILERLKEPRFSLKGTYRRLNKTLGLYKLVIHEKRSSDIYDNYFDIFHCNTFYHY